MSVRWTYRWRAFRRVHGQLRSVLAVLCLGLGVATLMQVLALAAGTRNQMAAILADAGTRTLTINAGNVTALPNRGSGVALAETLTLADYRALTAANLALTQSAAVSSGSRVVEYRELALGTNIFGTQPQWFALQHYTLARGRLLDDADGAGMARVAVLGARAAELLFGADQEGVLTPDAALGQTILIGRMPFEVVGVLQARGAGQTGMSLDEGIYVPLSTALRRVFNVAYLNSILLETHGIDDLPPLRARVDGLLRDAHHLAAGAEPDYALLDASRAIAALERNQQFAGLFFRTLAALILLMAGGGIFAVNHLNTKERVGEFGLRRAVGARRLDIARLVLGETSLLGLAGGVTGLLLGAGGIAGLQAFTAWMLVLDLRIAVQALGAAVFLSMLAALLPAWNAARNSPLAALNRI